MSHQIAIRKAIVTAIKEGCSYLWTILSKTRGADPRLVNATLKTMEEEGKIVIKNEEYRLTETYITPNWAKARAQTANKLVSLPKADPLTSQWWFDIGTCTVLSKAVWGYVSENPVAFLGTPILAYYYSVATGMPCTVLDGDNTILSHLGYPDCVEVVQYDVANPLPKSCLRKYYAVVTDPPWYPHVSNPFIMRARALAVPEAWLFCVIPGALTRPGVETERSELITDLINKCYSIKGINNDAVSYIVPDFEAAAYVDIEGFGKIPWRIADLLIANFPEEWRSEEPDPPLPQLGIKDFFLNLEKPRVFLRKEAAEHSKGPIIEEVEDFGATVSTRGVAIKDVGLWNSEKRGFKIRDPNIVERVLGLWAHGISFEQAFDEIKDVANAKVILDALDKELGLWTSEGRFDSLRYSKRLDEAHLNSISSKWAAVPSGREFLVKRDPFRLEFQRGRDRIIWSNAFKCLAAKTQIFPVEHSYLVRRRLTHSLTVSQLALTIAKAFGLDNGLTEAVALGHDVGHTPFGHPGEEAINDLFNDIEKRLGGFSHYEHGVDVLRWLETAYISPGGGGCAGLVLNMDVYEGVFKHTYRRSEGHNAQSLLCRTSKHTVDIDSQNKSLFKDDFCHLEGQAVRKADKISYLVEDLEDGIRAGVLSLKDLTSCRLFSRLPIDMKVSEGETELSRFISQRRAILSVIMRDMLEETDRSLRGVNSIEDVRKASDYCVKNSYEIETDIREVWYKLQKGKLHKDKRVQTANLRASNVIKELILLFTFCPDIIDSDFRESFLAVEQMTPYLKYYEEINPRRDIVKIRREYGYKYYSNTARDKNIKGNRGAFIVPLRNLIISKDYVVSMTDEKALQLYREFLGGHVPIR